jgi:isoamylase
MDERDSAAFMPNDIRGTFAALSDSALISHLQKIGVTAIELLPIHAFSQYRYLLEKNLSNYWGYNTLSYFSPEPAYIGSGELEEISRTVDSLHESGIEVILDVVYNHTCEGNHLGPTLSWKGIDNLSYYRQLPDDPSYYDNLTSCGNALNTSHPKVLQMIVDSLRMWATAYGIDGFTLHDLVSYNEKHNDANLEDNKDGANDNRSWSCGTEGNTDSTEINFLRAQQKKKPFSNLISFSGHLYAAGW